MRATLLVPLALLVACSSTTPIEAADASAGDDTFDPPPDAASATDSAPVARFRCDLPPPPGAPMPVAPPAPAAGCPVLAPGHNMITSSGQARELILVVPENPVAGERFPVLFMWHWIGGSADGFLERGEVEAASTAQRFIGIIRWRAARPCSARR